MIMIFFPADGKGSYGLLGVVVIYGDISIIKEFPEVLFLVDTVSENLSDGAVLCYLV